ncbi:hypothetical protein BRADO1995 [Bradyrhizobium sp. ORS 278]|nr:hypothetical protein BRADO1995 [Bradyrhizobium sp. ORS 278]
MMRKQLRATGKTTVDFCPGLEQGTEV